MNKFLSIIVLIALLYSSQVYAKYIPIVSETIDVVIGLGKFAEGAFDIIESVANFVVDMAAIVVDVVLLIPAVVGGWMIDTVCNVAGGNCNVLEQLTSPLIGDLFCREPFIGQGKTKLIKAGCESDDNTSIQSPLADTPPEISPGTFTTTAFVNALSTCTGITLSGVNAQGHNYAIVRDNDIVAELLSSETSYTDTGLTPHTNYEYKIRIPYPAESGYQTTDSAPIAAYTRCLPSCGFGVTSSSVAKYGTTELRWKCNYNDPVTDKGTCKISDSLGTVSKVVNELLGSLEIKVNENNQYTLQCTNVDGTIAIPQSVGVFTPEIKEVRP